MKGLESKLLPFKRIIGMRKTVPRRAANIHLTKVTQRRTVKIRVEYTSPWALSVTDTTKKGGLSWCTGTRGNSFCFHNHTWSYDAVRYCFLLLCAGTRGHNQKRPLYQLVISIHSMCVQQAWVILTRTRQTCLWQRHTWPWQIRGHPVTYASLYTFVYCMCFGEEEKLI